MATDNILNQPAASSYKSPVYTVTLADIVAFGAVTSGSVKLTTLPAGAVITMTRVKHAASVTGGTISAATARVITTNNNYGSGTLNVFAAPSNTAGSGEITDVTPKEESVGVATDVLLALTTTAGNFNTATSGNIQVWLRYEILAA